MSSYKSLIKKGIWEYDEHQELLSICFESLDKEIQKFQGIKNNFFYKLIYKKPNPPLGLYVYGRVGRGKSILMDIFSNSNTIKQMRRVHFHAFMQETHTIIREQRKKINTEDPINYVAEKIFSKTKVLCFDEFQINDAADAMILKRLFQKLFEMGLIMVSTSNQHPDELYQGGINRELFLPFVALLKEKCKVIEIKGSRDYRLEKLITNKVYFYPITKKNKTYYDSMFKKISGSDTSEKIFINIQKRQIEVEKCANGIGLMSFKNLCSQPLGLKDYLTIARSFKTFFISEIPIIDNEERNEIKRFINLIDVLYDNRTKVVFLAEESPENLYKGTFYKSEFKRTSSRLYEMQSESYLKQNYN